MQAKALEGKVAVVTGASSGIGKAIAKLLAAEGVKVVLGARRQGHLETLKKEIEEHGGHAAICVCDVTKRDNLAAIHEAAKKAFGSVDILVNNAGVMHLTHFRNGHESEWEHMVDVNIKGVLHGIGEFLPGMLERKSGEIVNISSDAGRKIFPGGGVYCATKWAVEAISQSLRLETAGKGVRVLSVQPGGTFSEIATGITDKEILEADSPFKTMRLLDPEDVARAVVYALSQPPHAAVHEVLIRPAAQGS